MKVLTVVGARPQFVKAFPVSKRLGDAHEEVLVHTGQHYDAALSDVFFKELPIPEPDYHLGVGSAGHAVQTALVMERLDPVVAGEAPDAVVVYGDTNTTLGAALVAAKRDPLLVHVEAGLRSGDRSMPEEDNRVLTDHCADLLLAPSSRAVRTLREEGLSARVQRTGDVMFDALLAARDRARATSTVLDDLDLADSGYVAATVHRERNTDDPDRLAAVLDALGAAPQPVVLPAHPRTTDAIDRHDVTVPEGVRVVEPLGYLDFLRLLDGAERVATDSGGVQKEAFYLDTPCVTLREETEWVETVECGWNVLVGADPDRIRRALADDREPPAKPPLYGDGEAADAVVSAVAAAVAAGGDPRAIGGAGAGDAGADGDVEVDGDAGIDGDGTVDVRTDADGVDVRTDADGVDVRTDGADDGDVEADGGGERRKSDGPPGR